MKKILLFIILLIPFYVYAEDSCSQDDIQIESITLDSTQGNIEQTSEPTNDNNSINLGLKANVIDDNAVYKVVIKNTSNQDYTFDKSSLSTDYLNYDITYEDNSDIVKAGESKTIYLKVHYATKPATTDLTNGVVTTQPKVTFNLQKEEEVKTIIEEVVNAITNPNTGDKVLIYLGLLIISLIITFILLRKYKKAKLTTMLITTFLITTQIVKAVCTCQLNINTELEIDAKEAIFLTGKEVNIKMKELAGTDTTITTARYNVPDTNILSIVKSETEPIEANKQDANIVSTPESGYPIYMWFDNGTIYWWSEDNNPSTNNDASNMFYMISNLNNIQGVETFDLSNTQIFESGFYNTSIESLGSVSNWNTSSLEKLGSLFNRTKITSLDGIENWNTSNFKDIQILFSRNDNLTDISALKNWNITNVENIQGLFSNDISLENIDALSDWNLSNVISIEYMFYKTAISSVEALRNWKFPKANSMTYTFASCSRLTDIDALSEWDTSNIKYFNYTFAINSFDSLEPLKNWDLSNATEIQGMFNGIVTITNLNGIENWDTSNIKSFRSTFHNCSKLMDASAINGWDVSSGIDFSYMFNISNDVKTTEKYSALPELDLSNWNMSNANQYKYFMESLKYVTSEFTIRGTNIIDFASMLEDCANEGGQVTVNYTADTEDIVDQMIATKSANGNIVKGVLKE
ncbi:MAG: BspA family leucine-rich repeat surface protein [Bacilli bacterium]|nr:BspA family leucine-rich repeat surface protein [Bacilli bacterium]